MVNLKNKKSINISLVLVGVFFTLFSCKSIRDTNSDKSKKNSSNCEDVASSYSILNYRYLNNDTLIGPETEWNDGAFDENKHIDILKKQTALEINYTPIKRAVKGYYIIKKSHLIHCEKWLEKECPETWKEIERYKSKYKKQEYLDKKDIKIDTVETGK